MKLFRILLLFIGVLSALLVSSCDPDTLEDKTAPVVKVLVPSVDVTEGAIVGIVDGELTIGGRKVAEWSDETIPLSALKVSVTVGGHIVGDGSILSEEGTLKISVTDQSGNQVSATVMLTVVKDLTAPEVKVTTAEINIGSGAVASISEGLLKIGDSEATTWSDDKTPSAELKVEVWLAGKAVESGDTLSEAGILTLAVTDQSGNRGEGTISILMDTTTPVVTVAVPELNIGSRAAISISDATLSVGDTEVATWSDDMTPASELRVVLAFNDKTVESGDTLSAAGTLKISVTEQNGNVGEGFVAIAVDTTAPDVNVILPEINVGAGTALGITGSSLSVGDTEVATWSDDMTATDELKVAVTFNGKPVNDGDILAQEGTLSIVVTDQNGNVGEATVSVTMMLAYGLESLGELTLQVDKETNLLEGVTFASGVTLERVEVSFGGTRTAVPNPEHFVAEYPGTCDLFFILKLADGSTAEESVTGLVVAPLESKELALKPADVLADYPFYEILPAGKQDFIYGHVLTSYANRQWFRQDITYILMGEAPLKEEYLIENVGNTNSAWYTSHGSDGYFHIISITPDANVKACAGEWKYAEDYVNSHPDERLMFSCALDCLGGDDHEILLEDPNYYSLKNILTNPNCVFSISGGNVRTIQYILEESQPIIPYGQYMSASVSSNLNNKITVCGYYPGRDNIFGVNEDSRRPIGFGRDKVNIVIPFTPLVSSNGQEYTNTNSSYPAGALSSALGNYLSILLYNNPGWTLNDAMTLMLEKYLYEEPLKYLNDDGQVVDGDNWNFFRCITFLEDQALHKDDMEAVQLSGDFVQLPSDKGMIYTGKGVQFEYNGTYYDAVEGNESLLAAALAAGDGAVLQRWSRERWLKMGGSGSAQLEARLVNSSCETIPDIKLSRTVAVY